MSGKIRSGWDYCSFSTVLRFRKVDLLLPTPSHNMVIRQHLMIDLESDKIYFVGSQVVEFNNTQDSSDTFIKVH